MLGFDYEVTWPAIPSVEEQDRFIDQLLANIVAPRRLSLGGGVDGGFVSARKRSPSEEDRAAFETWLRRWPGVQAVEVGPLRDAWYDEPLVPARRSPRANAAAASGAGIEGFIGVLAAKTTKCTSIDDLTEAASQGWSGEQVQED